MILAPEKVLKKSKGIIVWDFDGVLFETKRQITENTKLLEKIGISDQMLVNAYERIKRKKGTFSVSSFVRELNRKKYSFSEKKVRKIFYANFAETGYYNPKVDRLLHRMRKRGFIQMILSFGDARFQRKKMFMGCGQSFPKHFARICTTTRPKFITLAKLKRRVPKMRIIFVDDTKENLEEVEKHIPEIVTIHYSNMNGHFLESLEKKIISHAK